MKKELKIGILSLSVMVVSFFVLNFLRGRDIFNREMDLVGYFDDVEGLAASDPVSIKGFAAGQVSSISYNKENNNFEVVCSVGKEFNIPSDSRLVINSTSIMGSKGVRIEQGKSEIMAGDGSILETGSEPDLMSILSSELSPMLAKLGGTIDTLTLVLSNVNGVLSEQNRQSIQSSLEHLNRTLAAADNLASSFDGKSEEINAIVDNLKQLSLSLNPIAEKAGNTLDNINEITAQIKDGNIGETVGNIGKAASSLDKTIQEVSSPLDSLLNNVDNLVKSIQENPKKYIKITIF